MRTLLIALLLGSSSLLSAQPTSKIDPAALAVTFIDYLLKNDYSAAVQTFDEKVAAAVPEAKLRGLWEAVPSQFGAFRSRGTPYVNSKGDLHIVITPLEFEKGTLELQLAYNIAGRVAGILIRPAADARPFVDAPYVTPAAFTEREVIVDAGGWPLPATLAMPVGEGPFPAVVLVHGSGPHDRDESLGPNKPFRDLARGLASRGIATLRYEKRTRQFGAKSAAQSTFTVKDEVVDDAMAAVRLLTKTSGVDARRVVVLGHSLGGTLAPRIASAAGTDVAGVVILAGAVRPLDELLIAQARYLANSDGTISPQEKAQIESFEKLQATLKTLKPGDPAPGAGGIDLPVAYWLDLREYAPARVAGTLKVPVLIAQGARDYQVTTADFEMWKAALGSRPDVTMKLYPELNHLFMTGKGPSVPTEYLTAGHVDAEVVQDIAEWIQRAVPAAR